MRPTSDRVREAIFSILGPLEGLSALDLFAGSGALGVEALSRGAREVVFVDRDPQSVAAVRANLAAVGAQAAVVRRDAAEFLAEAASRRDASDAISFDLIFVDPPYSLAPRLAGALSERLPAVLARNGRIVTESSKRAPLELTLPLADERRYGDTRIGIYRGA